MTVSPCNIKKTEQRHVRCYVNQSQPDVQVCGLLREDEQSKGFGLALGFFDGVHRGHQRLLLSLLQGCQERELIPAVYTFDYLPKQLLSHLQEHVRAEGEESVALEEPEAPRKAWLENWGLRIQTSQIRADFLAELGVRYSFEQRFTERFRQLEPAAFLEELCQYMPCKLIVVGSDFRFGRGRSGDVDFLRSWGREHAVDIVVVDQVEAVGGRISSTRIRQALLDGRLEDARRLLGHPFLVEGRVVSGRALGRTVGMPTANMRLDRSQVLLPFGVYASRTLIGQRWYDSISNIGLRPTVETEASEPLLETYVYDFNGDLYGQELQVQLLRFWREERSFPNLDAVKRAVDEDSRGVRRYLASRERLVPISRGGGVAHYHLPSLRFGSNLLVLECKIRAESRKNAARNLAQELVLRHSAQFPETVSFNRCQDAHYGALVQSELRSEGDLQLLYFELSALDQGLESSERPFREMLPVFFRQILGRQGSGDRLFRPEDLERERENLILDRRAQERDKAYCAARRATALLFPEGPWGLPAGGAIEDLETLSLEEVSRAWQDLLREAQINVYTAGHLEEEDFRTIQRCLEGFAFQGRKREQAAWPELGRGLLPQYRPPVLRGRQSEQEDLRQARLYMAWRGLPAPGLGKPMAQALLNSMFGGDSHSLLFEEIRERQGLAYSIYSYPKPGQLSLVVSAGLAPSAVEEAVRAVREQLALIAAGHFSDELLEKSRKLLLGQLSSAEDRLSAKLFVQLQAWGRRQLWDHQDAAQALKALTRKDVIKLAQSLEECICYSLGPRLEGPEASADGGGEEGFHV